LRGIVQKADTTHYKGALKFEIPTKTKPSTSKIKILKPL
jgi:hypothetical protein